MASIKSASLAGGYEYVARLRGSPPAVAIVLRDVLLHEQGIDTRMHAQAHARMRAAGLTCPSLDLFQVGEMSKKQCAHQTKCAHVRLR